MKNYFKYLPFAALLMASHAFAQTTPTANMLCPAPFTTYVDKGGTQHTTNAQSVLLGIKGGAITDLQQSGCLPQTATTVTAATDPTSTNDNTEGYQIGSLWVDSTGPKVYTATAVGTAAATWTQIGAVTNLNPTFTTALLGNPVQMTASGNCTVAAINGGTCVPIVGVTGHVIYVTNYIVKATGGTAATCTGVYVADTAGSPVVVSTIAAAVLTTSTYNMPGAASNTLGVGFGPAGLTSGDGVQLLVDGSACTTMTGVNYTINYVVQ